MNSLAGRSGILGLFISIISLMFASLACQIDLGGPARPGILIKADEKEATEVAQIWSNAISHAVSSGQVIVLFNEVQITGFVEQRIRSDSTPILNDPQIYLRQGQIQVYGTLARGFLLSTALIRIEPSVDADGQLEFRLVEASVGPIPAPDLLMESISTILTEALTGSIGSLATGIRISSIAIADGEMSIVGEIR